ncbi:class I SAM-dependent DNA methyltransferase [Prauserella endophytica]|uniref:Class I SAM-dependent methyltransferase n=1 Tax=Prauserella endophytica TaxID=1592324 RepID=A0ABY2S902_9PSEU|nr:class I SAM-dependent methyltransferase [Prauserella endophytica]TKG71774.1 class I SAM-dependent methyltransferase [Prauserella endophytica]
MTEPSYLDETRIFYDTLAVDYAAMFKDELAAKPFLRAMLGAFAELVLAGGGGRVADVGCGPGLITAHLHGLGLDVFGLDLSPEMVAVARAENPGLRYDVGSMTALDLADGSLSGIVAMYSLIHTPLERLPSVFAEFRRVLAPGGQLLLAFQVGDDVRLLERPLGHPVSLGFQRLRPERLAELLGEAGFEVRARFLREPDDDEKSPHAHLLARRG